MDILGHGLVIDGNLYHVGANLRGNILNPDFMASISPQGKTFNKTKWIPLDKGTPQHSIPQSQRILQKLEGIQAYLLTHIMPENASIKEAIYSFKELRSKEGGTCTSAAVMFHNEIIKNKMNSHQLQKFIEDSNGKSRIAHFLLNPLTKKILDFTWNIFPFFIREKIIHPLQSLTRGKKPIHLQLN